jgi:hypothetical protein
MGYAMRWCLGSCGKKFWSSGSAERFCKSCRKKLKNKPAYGVDILPLTPGMAKHIHNIETGLFVSKPNTISEEDMRKVEKYLDNPADNDFDDTFIYAALVDETEAEMEKEMELLDKLELKRVRKRGRKPKQKPDRALPDHGYHV